MNTKTKSTLMALLRVAVAMTIFVVAVINYEQLKNIDVRALVDASASLAIALATIWGVYLVKSVLFIIPAMLIYVSICMAFPPVTACLISLVGIILEVTVTYFLGRGRRRLDVKVIFQPHIFYQIFHQKLRHWTSANIPVADKKYFSHNFPP